jgi:DNA-binding CsgD family transcriptional regulator
MPSLLGRARELAAIRTLLARAAEGGGSTLLVRGEPGIGKSALLAAAAELASGQGLAVLRTGGVATETTIPFAPLQRLLRPCLGRLDALAPPQREALEAAVGLRSGDSPQVFLIALAVLDLLSEASADAPALVLVEDAHWLDDATADVLAFVARRLELEPLVLLFSARDPTQSRVRAARLPELALGPLDEASAGQLLDEHAPGLPATARRRVLALAQGNPLALIELPRSRVEAAGPIAELALTERLERVFSERLDPLPAHTRTALLVAALDEGGALSSTLAAAAALDAAAGSVAAFAPAERARLVVLGADTVRFGHPLVPAAVGAAATTADRHAAHAALAGAYAADPDRSVWHEAAALSGPDEAVAARLDEAAARAERRGAPVAVAAALERAAELTPDERLRGARLVRAAEAELALGRAKVAQQLLARARALDLDEEQRTRVAFILEISDDGNWTGAERAASFARLADDLTASGDGAAALHALHTVSMRLWWGNPDPEVRRVVVAAAERAAAGEDEPVRLSVVGLADPVGSGASVRAGVARYAPDARDPLTMHLLGVAADATFSHDLALPFLGAAVEGFREQGRIGLLGEALTSQAYVALHLAKAPLALAAAEEAERLARDTGRPLWAVAARLARAIVAGERGEDEHAEAVAAEAEAVLMTAGAHPLLGIVQFARGRGAVAHQRYEDGYFHLRRLFDPTDLAYQPLVGLWGLSDLVESALNLDRREEALGHLEELERAAETSNGSLLRAELAYARPLVASDDRAGELYQAALEHGLRSWPCYRGRLLLAYGRWLRRQRRVAESRAPLRAARELFDALGFGGLAESARGELRASGETSRKRTLDLRDQLTPQELQIAQMAAEGLTNREIGSKLYLSHRTVGSHLYRLFPKLGITSRSQLREALAQAD